MLKKKKYKLNENCEHDEICGFEYELWTFHK